MSRHMKKRKKPTQAEQADRHKLYELSVQCVESEVDFVDATFKKIRKRRAKTLREDFCGTAGVCCEWVKRRTSNSATGVDLDPEVLQWGRDNNFEQLKKSARQRVRLIEANVLKYPPEPVDVVLAMNFSYWLLKDRKVLKSYFKRVHKALVDDGIFFMDAYGGYDSFKEVEEPREVEDDKDGFTYTWEQAKFNPVTNNLLCHIHFDFPDGSSLKEAFTYDWRLWTLPEIKDLLIEAGFSKVTIYWQGWDEDGEPDGEFYATMDADADAGWISYITAEK